MEWLKKSCLFFKSFWLIIIIFLAFIFILFIFHSYWSHFHSGELSNKTIDWANFGSYFGGTLSPILAFFSFLALCYTINLQNKQLQRTDEQLAQNKLALEQNAKALELNNQELNNSTEQLKLSAKAQLEMEKTQKIQQFEGLFTFMLGELKKYNDIIKDKKFNIFNYIDINNEPNIYDFRYANTKLRADMELVNFFMYLYQILKLIKTQDEQFFSFDKKKQYANIVRAGLDGNSLKLLFLNCIKNNVTNDSFSEFANLLEFFEFFEHLRLEVPTCNKPHQHLIYLSAFYKRKAYGDGENIKKSLEVLIDGHKKNDNFCLYFDGNTGKLKLEKIGTKENPKFIKIRELIFINHESSFNAPNEISINNISFSFNIDDEVIFEFLPSKEEFFLKIDSLGIKEKFSYSLNETLKYT